MSKNSRSKDSMVNKSDKICPKQIRNVHMYNLRLNISLSHRYNYYMAIFSVTFLLLSYQLTTLLGPVGFILANCTNMIFRISYSTYYIYMQFRPIKLNPLNGIRPGKIFLLVLLIMGTICKVSQVKKNTFCFVSSNNF